MARLSPIFLILFFLNADLSKLFAEDPSTIQQYLTILKSEYFHDETLSCYIEQITGGQSDAQIYKLNTQDKTFALRINPKNFPDEHASEAHVLKMAADAGVAPRVYFNYQNGHMILMDYIDQDDKTRMQDLNTWIIEIAKNLKKLHNLDVSHVFLKQPEDRTANIISYLKMTKKLLPQMEQVAKIYLDIKTNLEQKNPGRVIVHGDLSPLNLLYSKDKVYFIDFSETCTGDYLYDLAYFSFFHDLSSNLENQLIYAYLMKAIDDESYTRFCLHKRKIIASLALDYYCLALYKQSHEGEKIDTFRPINDLSEYLKAFRNPFHKYDAQFLYEISQSACKVLEK